MRYKKLKAGEKPGTYILESSVVSEAHILKMANEIVVTRLKKGEKLDNPTAASAHLQTMLQDKEHEVFVVLFLDTQNQILKCEEMFRGTIDSAAVYPREVIKRALELNAKALILSHNHPSGIPKPSTSDRMITNRIKEAADLFDIDVLDHIVVGHDGTVSFAEKGYL